ncbi:hypothetical protein G9A89_004161 [Geosiphon pyriformis]|nr:hypothetical protein G9A89_004161 [Geosiphon pyriformis]
MKKSAKDFSADTVSKDIASKKKRKSGVLKDSTAQKIVGFKAGDTTESDSVDIEEEFLIEETSVDYGKNDLLEERDINQTPKESKIVTKQALGKPLSKINFLDDDNDGDILSGGHLELLPPLRNLVNVLVHKSFALDIGLEKVTGKSSQEKLSAVRKLFLGINGFGGASTPSKFTSKKAKNAKILVNTNLKKPTGHLDWAVVVKKIPVGTSVEAVRAALSEFGSVVSIKMQLVELWQKAVVKFAQLDQADLVATRWSILLRKNAHRALLYTLPMSTNVNNIWDFIGSVGEKHASSINTLLCMFGLNVLLSVLTLRLRLMQLWKPLLS